MLFLTRSFASAVGIILSALICVAHADATALRDEILRPPQGENPQEPEECLVRLIDGRLLRGKTSWSAATANQAAMKLDTAQGPLTIEAAEIISSRRLIDVRREGQALRQSLPEGPRRAHQMATWYAQQGLIEEMEKELDPILAADMNDRIATSILRSLDIETLVPLDETNMETLVRSALRAGEAALAHPTKLRLAELRVEYLSPDLYEGLLERSLVSKRTNERRFAVGAIARLMPEEGLKRVIERAVLDRQKDVRSTAQRILAQSPDPGIVFPLLRALHSKHPQVRLNAIEALAQLGDPRAIRDLILRVTHSGGTGQRVNVSFTKQISYVSDFDVEVAQAAAIADPVINVLQEGAVLDVTVIGTHGETDYYIERSRAADALRRISGKDLGRDPKAWTEWWQTNQEEVVTAYLERRGFPLPTDNG